MYIKYMLRTMFHPKNINFNNEVMIYIYERNKYTISILYRYVYYVSYGDLT